MSQLSCPGNATEVEQLFQIFLTSYDLILFKHFIWVNLSLVWVVLRQFSVRSLLQTSTFSTELTSVLADDTKKLREIPNYDTSLHRTYLNRELFANILTAS